MYSCHDDAGSPTSVGEEIYAGGAKINIKGAFGQDRETDTLVSIQIKSPKRGSRRPVVEISTDHAESRRSVQPPADVLYRNETRQTQQPSLVWKAQSPPRDFDIRASTAQSSTWSGGGTRDDLWQRLHQVRNDLTILFQMRSKSADDAVVTAETG